MDAWNELFTTDVGLLSLGVIVFMLGMGVFYLRFFLRNIREDEARARAAEMRPGPTERVIAGGEST